MKKGTKISKKGIGKTLKACFLAAPLLLGMIGFTVAGESFLQALYASICLYGMGQSDMPPNWIVEVARWLAPLTTVSAVLLVIKSLRYYAHVVIALLSGKSVAVYGPEKEKSEMLKTLGRRGINMNDRAVKAHNYILIGSEEENLNFYREHLSEKNAKVFLKSSDLPMQVGDPRLLPFRPEETASRIFWQKHSPYEISKKKGHKISVAVIGFGKLGKEIILSALQNNIFSPDQKITYHVFGKEDGFSHIYRRLSEISDEVIFHSEPWQESLSTVEDSDMLIVAEQSSQLELLATMSLALPAKEIFVFSCQHYGVELMSGDVKRCHFTAFDWQGEAMDPDSIMREEAIRLAKRINTYYNNKIDATDEEAEALWLGLDGFDRLSNVRAADFEHVARRIYSDDELAGDKIELLAELEHIRWSRYHYLENWKQGEPVGGESKNKNKTERIHRLLVPYSELSEDFKENDRKNVRILFDLRDDEKEI